MKEGDELTIAVEIIDISGNIIFTKGQKIIIKEILKSRVKYSNNYQIWIDEKIDGFKLVEHYGIWFTGTFEETKHLK